MSPDRVPGQRFRRLADQAGRSCQSWRLFLIPLAVLIFLAYAGHAFAGSIYVFDGFASGGRNFFVGGLVGERGFTLDGFFRLHTGIGETNAFIACGQPDIPPVGLRCHPGDAINLGVFGTGVQPDIPGHATLDGKSYVVSGLLFDGAGFTFTPGSACGPPGPPASFCAPPTGGLAYTFIAPTVILPPFPAAGSAILTAPFQFSGLFGHFDANGQIVTDELVGSGITIVEFIQHPASNGEIFWEAGFSSQSFDIQPTPEPTTLLLWGTTAAGLGLARWRHRRRKQQQP